ncbi:ATP-binding protein [Falsiroseomonas sp.]|uniref:ATP-binding protein n=1 Tax=Falsiroseomonas sp. TaxID=2870721 RepID=UPI003567A213
MGTDESRPVTLLFTDVQGSTRLLQALGDAAYGDMLSTLSAMLRAAFRAHAGEEVDSQGDGFFVAFPRSPMDAVAAAVQCQRLVAAAAWPADSELRIRIAINTGLVRRAASGSGPAYVGLDVHRAARLCEAGHGGQILVSEATQRLTANHLPPEIGLRALGEHRLRDFAQAEQVFQLMAPDLAAEFPPLRVPNPRPSNLPVPRTSLLGRQAEIAELVELLRRPETGLVTLTGVAGTGKTRLAIAAASRAAGLFRHGVCFVELAPLADPELVISVVVRSLGLQEAGPTTPEEILLQHLRDKEMLLVLDNFEHLLGAAPAVATMLGACPQLKILATSRAALHVYGEREYAVPPLALPAAGPLPANDNLLQYPAIALFAERASAAAVRFAITPRNAAAVVTLCARLDGLPLAIELAAARAALLAPAEMVALLGDAAQHGSLDLLTGGARDAPGRHRTLRAAIGWSIGLLSSEDQLLFRRLAVFVGGFDLNAAAEIVGRMEDGHAAAASDAAARAQRFALLDRMATLIGNSLLHRVERADAEARFSMLETIREYGLGCLTAHGELAAASEAHARHCLVLADRGALELGGAQQAGWLARLDEEHPNFRAALAWSFSDACADRQLGPRLACALWVFWFRRAYLREGSRWMQHACAALVDSAPAGLRATLLTAQGSFARMLGDFERAETLLEEATAIWRELDDAEGIGWALSHLGLVKQWLGQLDAGVEMLEESVALRRRRGEERGIARSLFHLAIAEDFRGNDARAAKLYHETLEVQRRVGDVWGSARVLGYLAKVVLRAGGHARAESLCARALKMSSQVADRWGVALALSGLGGAALARGDHPAATMRLKEGLLLFRDLGAQDRVAECLQDLASLARQAGAVEASVRLSAAAETVQTASRLAFWPAIRARRDAEMAAARASLGDAAFEAAWSEGQAMSLDDAIAEMAASLEDRIDAPGALR